MSPAIFRLFGSCASTAPYYRLRPPDLHLAAYCSGSSLVSVMSPALPLDPADLESLKPGERRMVEGDVTRSALELFTQKSDFVLLDLGDEICDLLRVGDSFVTQTVALKRSCLPSRFPNHEILRREDPATTRLWMVACTGFCRGPLAAIPQDRIIIHRVQLASECLRTDDCPEHDRHDAFLSRRALTLNPILEAYFQHLWEQLPGAHVIDVPVCYRFADRHHRYGVHGLHYLEAYEQCFILSLQDIAGQGLARGGG